MCKDQMITEDIFEVFRLYITDKKIEKISAFDSSSTNIIVNINDKYVIKKKPIQTNIVQQSWYESIFKILEEHKLCNIFLKTNEDRLFTYYEGYQYCLMYLCEGSTFTFGNLDQLSLVASFINKLHQVPIPPKDLLKMDMLLTMPKSETLYWCRSTLEFNDCVYQRIADIADRVNADIKTLDLCLEIIAESDLRNNYNKLKFTLSHGEMQGQNILFGEHGEISVVDWDSISIRPAIYDIAMSICFLCRKSRGRFLVDKDRYKWYLNHFQLNKMERIYLTVYLLLVFLPDVKLLEEYLNYDSKKAKWYIDWSCGALKDILLGLSDR